MHKHPKLPKMMSVQSKDQTDMKQHFRQISTDAKKLHSFVIRIGFCGTRLTGNNLYVVKMRDNVVYRRDRF